MLLNVHPSMPNGQIRRAAVGAGPPEAVQAQRTGLHLEGARVGRAAGMGVGLGCKPIRSERTSCQWRVNVSGCIRVFSGREPDRSC